MTIQDEPSDSPLPPFPDQPVSEAMMRDWVTIWQSEAAALGVDRELHEAWAAMAQGWAENWAKAAAQGGMAGEMVNGMAEMLARIQGSGYQEGGSWPAASWGADAKKPETRKPGTKKPEKGGSHGDATGSTRPDAAPRPASTVDASDAGGELAALRDELVRLRHRVEQLERIAPDLPAEPPKARRESRGASTGKREAGRSAKPAKSSPAAKSSRDAKSSLDAKSSSDD